MKRKKFSALTLPPHLDSSNSCAVVKQLEMSVMMGQRKKSFTQKSFMKGMHPSIHIPSQQRD